MYARTCDIQTVESVFGAYLDCHPEKCNRESKNDSALHKNTQKKEVIDIFLNEIKPDLLKGQGYSMSDIRDRVNKLLDSEKSINNRDLKVLIICAKYGDKIRFSTPLQTHKSTMIYICAVIGG